MSFWLPTLAGWPAKLVRTSERSRLPYEQRHAAREETITRARILRAGVAQFQASGFHGTGVAAILAEARAPKGSFYHHFPGGKEQLAIEAVEWLAGEVDTFLDRLAAKGAGGLEMALGMARYAASGLAHADVMRGSLITVLATDAVQGSSAIGAALERAVEGWLDKLRAGFAREGAYDPECRAKTAIAAIEGATILARIAGRPEVIGEVVKAALVVA